MTKEDLRLLMHQHGIGNGYVVNRDTYELRMVNPPMLSGLGKDFDAWRGKLCYNFIYGAEKPCPFCKMDKTSAGETLHFQHKSPINGTQMLMRNYKTTLDREPLFVQLSYPIPDEVQQLQPLTKRMTAVQMLSECGKSLLSEKESVESILQELAHFYAGSCGYLYIKGKNGSDFSVHSTYCNSQAQKNCCYSLTQSFLLTDKESWKSRFQEKNYFFLEDVTPLQNALGEEHILTKRFYKNMLIAPLFSENDFLGVLVVENLGENFHELHLIATILVFLNHHFFMKRHVEQLEVQQRTHDTVLSCVKTLVSEDSFNDAMKKLLNSLLDYFQGERGFLMKNTDGLLDISVGNQIKQSERDTKFRLEERSLEVLTGLFDLYGEDDILFLDSILDKVDDTFTVKEVLREDGIERLLALRLYNGQEVSYFLLLENPKNLENRDVILKSVSKFMYNHMMKDALQRKLEQLSYSDGLTCLYNRNYFQRFVEDWKKKSEEVVGIVFADVNGLKKVNDNFGHEAGDVLIRWSGWFLHDITKSFKNSLVFRLAGDEFVCVLPSITRSEFEKIQKKIHENMKKQGEKHISFGVYWTEGTSNLEDAVKKADASMYHSKQEFYKEQARDERSVQQSLDDLKVELTRLNQVLLKEGGKLCQL